MYKRQAVYLPKNHFIKEESMATDEYLSLFYPFDQLDLVKKGITSTWNVSRDRTMVALTIPSTAKIGLVVSLGKPIIPDIVGKTKSEAEELLDKYSLKLGKVTEKHTYKRCSRQSGNA